jgi:hypothetical protein
MPVIAVDMTPAEYESASRNQSVCRCAADDVSRPVFRIIAVDAIDAASIRPTPMGAEMRDTGVCVCGARIIAREQTSARKCHYSGRFGAHEGRPKP